MARGFPFHFTVDANTKLLPLMARLKVGPPAFILPGESEARAGTGFELVTVKVTALELPPSGAGVETATITMDALAIAPDGTSAFNCVSLT